ETLGGRPGVGAIRGLRRRLPIERRLDGGGEVVPKGYVLRLLARMVVVARDRRGARQRDDRVPVFARIERKLIRGQLAAFPALVERMLQDVPALPGLVDLRAKLHLTPSSNVTPAGC